MRRHGVQSVLRSARVAKRVGLAPSDLECLDLLVLDGPLTPGAIIAGTGLSSASVTAMVDRLVRRGLVRRDRDPADGRRVNVSVVREALKPIAAEYSESAAIWDRLLENFREDELDAVARYLEATLSVLATLNQPPPR